MPLELLVAGKVENDKGIEKVGSIGELGYFFIIPKGSVVNLGTLSSNKHRGKT